MPIYVSLFNWTQLGAEQVKDSPTRLDAGREIFKTMGVTIKDVYLTMGRYDLVCVIEAPDDATFARAMLTLGAKGTTHTESMKAFSEDEYRRIIGSLAEVDKPIGGLGLGAARRKEPDTDTRLA